MGGSNVCKYAEEIGLLPHGAIKRSIAAQLILTVEVIYQRNGDRANSLRPHVFEHTGYEIGVGKGRIVVECENNIVANLSRGRIAGCYDAERLVIPNEPDLGKGLLHQLGRTIGRAIVDHQQVHGDRLIEHGFDRTH